MLENIFAIPVLDKWLLSAPLHQTVALVNKAAVRALQTSALTDELRHLLPPKPAAPPQPLSGTVQPLFLGILPTRDCNLRCIYCDFHVDQDAGQIMNHAIAVAAVDWIFKHVQSLRGLSLEIHFFGGEPFFASELVDLVIHRARQRAQSTQIRPRFEVSTNGVFSASCAQFIGDYFDGVVLSFDGPAEIQNRNRPAAGGGSYDTVSRTAHILSRSGTELCFRTCVTQASVHRLEEIVRWFGGQFLPAIINFETLKPTRQSNQAGLTPPDPYVFAENFMRAYETARNMGIQCVYNAADPGSPRVSFCPVGKDALIVSPDGSVNACYLLEQDWKNNGLDLHLGSCDENGLTLDYEAIERVRKTVYGKPRCSGCFCKFRCAGGCHVSETYPGCSTDYTDFCIQTRLISAGLMLHRLGNVPLARRLLSNPEASLILARHPSDTLSEAVN